MTEQEKTILIIVGVAFVVVSIVVYYEGYQSGYGGSNSSLSSITNLL